VRLVVNLDHPKEFANCLSHFPYYNSTDVTENCSNGSRRNADKELPHTHPVSSAYIRSTPHSPLSAAQWPKTNENGCGAES
jgi:hypothetical protein